jgi:hypothetical protein
MINFRINVQKQIPPFHGVEVSPPQIKIYQAKLPREAAFVCWPPLNSQCKYPHLVEWTLQARGWGEPPINNILPGKPHPEEQFLFAGPLKIINANTPIWWSGPCRPGAGVSPPQIKFYQANPPRGAICVCWHLPNSQCKYPHLVEWTLRAPGLG